MKGLVLKMRVVRFLRCNLSTNVWKISSNCQIWSTSLIRRIFCVTFLCKI